MRLALVLALLTLAPTALAQAPGYEQRHVARALAHTGLHPHFIPFAKEIEFVRIVRYDIFVDFEPLPTFPNAVHVKTKKFVVEREMLLGVGDAYDQTKLVESARNLRSLGTFSLVAIVPVVAKDPQKIGLLVVTRDLWSLRLENAWQITGDTLNTLFLQIVERNLFGRDKTAAINFQLVPVVWSTGQLYSDRRLFGNKLALFEQANLHFNRATDAYEGIDGRIDLSRPFYNLSQKWGFIFTTQFNDRIARRLQVEDVVTWDDPQTDEVEAIPQVWSQEAYAAAVVGRRQFGGDFVHRFSLGFGFTHFEANPNSETQLPEANRESFERNVLPRSRTQVYPTASWSFFENRFRTFQNIALYGLSEDMQLGPSIALSLRTPLAALGSTEDALNVAGSVNWTGDWAGDGLWSFGVGAEGRLEAEGWIDERFLLRTRGALPSTSWGRGVARFDWLGRRKDTSNSLVSLGGDNGLRGYPTQAFIGTNAERLRGNFEWRAPPLVWSFLHVGLAAFYDAGSVYEDFDDLVWRQSVGLGARFLLPQINRSVTRLDVGFPVDGSGFMITVTAGTGQAVPVTSFEDQRFDGSDVGGLTYQP